MLFCQLVGLHCVLEKVGIRAIGTIFNAQCATDVEIDVHTEMLSQTFVLSRLNQAKSVLLKDG